MQIITSRQDNIGVYNEMAIQWPTYYKTFSYFEFLIVAPTAAYSMIQENSVDRPNDRPQIGETFNTYEPLKMVSNVSFPFILNLPFKKSLSDNFRLEYGNETFSNKTTFKLSPFLLEEVRLTGKNTKTQCEDNYGGILVDDYTCEVYYKLTGVCLLFDGTSGRLYTNVGAGCANYPSINPYPYAQYSVINVQSGESLKRVSSNGQFVVRDVHDPYIYLLGLNCNGGFCESKRQSGEILIVSGILLLLVIWIVPVFLSIAYCVLKEGTFYSLSDIQEKNDINPHFKPETFYENVEHGSKEITVEIEEVMEDHVEIKTEVDLLPQHESK